MDGCLGAFDWLPLGQSNEPGVWSVTQSGAWDRGLQRSLVWGAGLTIKPG